MKSKIPLVVQIDLVGEGYAEPAFPINRPGFSRKHGIVGMFEPFWRAQSLDGDTLAQITQRV